MSSWIDKRAEFQKRFDELSQSNVQGLITDLNQAVGSYISKAGLSQDPNQNPDYETIQRLMKTAESIQGRYSALNDDIQKYIASQAQGNNLSGLLQENGELQKQINRLEKIQDEVKVDVESAIARDELLRSRNTDVTRHQLFILDRPIRRGLIPYLWVLSVLFIGVGLVIFRMTAPTIGIAVGNAASNAAMYGAQATVPGMIMGFFSNRVVLTSLLVSALIVIFFLSLKIAGVFGK